jgi:hypothetical protein
MWFILGFIILVSIFGIRTTSRSNKLKQQFGSRLHAVGIHQSGLPQFAEGRRVDVLIGNGNLYIQSGQQTFELSLRKIGSAGYPKRTGSSNSRNYLVIHYEMNGRVRPIVLRFMKPAHAKAFLWEIEGQLFTRNSSDGIIRL